MEIGADPNYCRQSMIKQGILLYDKDGLEISEPKNNKQPINPLRLCIFYLCKCTNSDIDNKNLYKIASLLVKFGANKTDALDYFISLYGNRNEYDDENYNNMYNLLKS